MTGRTSHRRGLMAWMIACLVAAFVSVPLLDSFTCRGEPMNRPAASTAAPAAPVDAVVVDDHGASAASAASLPGHPGDATCVHGHCHHAGVAAPIVVADVSHLEVAMAAGLRAVTPVLHSAELAHAKPPPRA